MSRTPDQVLASFRHRLAKLRKESPDLKRPMVVRADEVSALVDAIDAICETSAKLATAAIGGDA